MADALGPNRLSRALNRPLWSPRLTDTPLRDLVRGRLTGRLNWRGAIRAAPLPTPVADAIVDVVRRTKLWRIEKAAVAQELIAHFADGLAGGASANDLLRDFGDVRAAAKLIRRAKRRNRPLAWHALKWTRRVLLALVAIYALIFARFALARPTVRVDYIARLNAPTLAAAEADRAWPIYRRAIFALGLQDQQTRDATIERQLDAGNPDAPNRKLVDATPADAEWPALTAWLDANADGIALLREAAGKPTFGFVYGPGGSQDDDATNRRQLGAAPESIDRSLMSVLLPYLSQSRSIGKVLAADARLAASRGDGARAAADLDAMLGVARQLHAPIVIDRLVGIGIADLTFDQIESTLASDPAALDDAALIGLAHHVATFGGDAPASLIDASGERASFHDIVQRLYSDDGRGDGILTMTGARALPLLGSIGGLRLRRDSESAGVAATAAFLSTVSAVTSRRAAIDEFDRLFDRSIGQFDRPRREWTRDDSVDARLREIVASPVLLARYLPVAILMPSLGNAANAAERTLGRREGVTAGLALELYRRRHGEYPSTLDTLVPTMLPRVPADRITGEPLKYRLIDGRPVVYSVGIDRVDDGGRAPDNGVTWNAANWDLPMASCAKGDWIVYDGRPAKDGGER